MRLTHNSAPTRPLPLPALAGRGLGDGQAASIFLRHDAGDRPPSGPGWDFHRCDLCAGCSRHRPYLPGDARHLCAVRRRRRLFGTHPGGTATAADAGHGLAGADARRDCHRDGSLWPGARRADAPPAAGAAAVCRAARPSGGPGLHGGRARSSDVARHCADARDRHSHLTPALPHRISSAGRRIGPRPAHRRCRGSFRHIRPGAVVFRTGRLPHRADDTGLLRAWAASIFPAKAF